jgi:hypothetical protein
VGCAACRHTQPRYPEHSAKSTDKSSKLLYVAEVAEPIAVLVQLVAVGDGHAVVASVGNTVAVRVLSVGRARAHIAGIRHCVAIRIERVVAGQAQVAHITDTIPIAIGLVGVDDWAVVALERYTVTVYISLIVSAGALIARLCHTVAVRVEVVDARVAGVAHIPI